MLTMKSNNFAVWLAPLIQRLHSTGVWFRLPLKTLLLLSPQEPYRANVTLRENSHNINQSHYVDKPEDFFSPSLPHTRVYVTPRKKNEKTLHTSTSSQQIYHKENGEAN